MGCKDTQKHWKRNYKSEIFALFYKKIAFFFADSEKSTTFAPANLSWSAWNTKVSGVWCNGNTADSGPAFPGSSPGTPTKQVAKRCIANSLAISLCSVHSGTGPPGAQPVLSPKKVRCIVRMQRAFWVMFLAMGSIAMGR